MPNTYSHEQIADLLGEVIALTDTDPMGVSVVVYREQGTLSPFKASLLTPFGDAPHGHVNIENNLELARYLAHTDDNAAVAATLPVLREECMARGIAFPFEAQRLTEEVQSQHDRLIQHQVEHIGKQGVRLGIKRTDVDEHGRRAMTIEGEAALVDACWIAVEAAAREAAKLVEL